MNAIATEEREAMRESFARFLSERSTESDVRAAMETDSGFDPALWAEIGAMGVVGLLVPPEFGGLGGGPVELELMMEEAGAALLCAPLFSSGVLAASLLVHSGDGSAKARLLPSIASGETVATVALTGDKGLWTDEGVEVVAKRDDKGWILNGHAAFVTDGNAADVLLVLANGAEGLRVFEVVPNEPGVERKSQQGFDLTMRFARVTFEDVRAIALSDTGKAAVDRMLNDARIALAGERAGACRRIFDITMNYIKNRFQFGRAIGSFQAIKHMSADALLETESCTSTARAAARALAGNTPDAEVLVNLAAFVTADSFSQVAATAIQLHGGIAYTWEYPAHLYLRRARTLAKLLGTPSLYRDRYIEALEKSA